MPPCRGSGETSTGSQFLCRTSTPWGGFRAPSTFPGAPCSSKMPFQAAVGEDYRLRILDHRAAGQEAQGFLRLDPLSFQVVDPQVALRAIWLPRSSPGRSTLAPRPAVGWPFIGFTWLFLSGFSCVLHVFPWFSNVFHIGLSYVFHVFSPPSMPKSARLLRRHLGHGRAPLRAALRQLPLPWPERPGPLPEDRARRLPHRRLRGGGRQEHGAEGLDHRHVEASHGLRPNQA